MRALEPIAVLLRGAACAIVLLAAYWISTSQRPDRFATGGAGLDSA